MCVCIALALIFTNDIFTIMYVLLKNVERLLKRERKRGIGFGLFKKKKCYASFRKNVDAFLSTLLLFV